MLPVVALASGAYIGSFFQPIAYVLYAASGVLGFGAAVIWTAQGKYLTDNSDNLTIARNAGVFWGIFQCSQFLGNLYVYQAFQKGTSDTAGKFIDKETRKTVYVTLTALSCAGVLFLFLMRRASNRDGSPVEQTQVGSSSIGTAFSLLKQGRMVALCVSFWFTGSLLSFAGAVYGNCIGYTLSLSPNPKPLVGLSGVFLALGEVVGGILFGILGPKTVIWGRNPIIILGFLVFGGAFGLIYANIPDSANFGNTYDVSIFNPPKINIAVACSFMMGFGDSCYNTQIYSILGTLYRDDSAPAFAIFKFVQSVATGVGMLYAKKLGLRSLLIILSVFLVLTIPTFMGAERIAARKQREYVDDETTTTAVPSTATTPTKQD